MNYEISEPSTEVRFTGAPWTIGVPIDLHLPPTQHHLVAHCTS